MLNTNKFPLDLCELSESSHITQLDLLLYERQRVGERPDDCWRSKLCSKDERLQELFIYLFIYVFMYLKFILLEIIGPFLLF